MTEDATKRFPIPRLVHDYHHPKCSEHHYAPRLEPSDRQPSIQVIDVFLSQENRVKIQQAIKAKPVVLFMKGTADFPECGFSRAAIQVLELQGVDPAKLQTYNVLADSELRSDIKKFSEWPTIPQLYVNGEFVGGCDILLNMHQSGELEKFLTENKVVVPETEGEAEAPSSSS